MSNKCNVVLKLKKVPHYLIGDNILQKNANSKSTNTFTFTDKKELIKILAVIAANSRAEKDFIFLTPEKTIDSVSGVQNIKGKSKKQKIKEYTDEFEKLLEKGENYNVIINRSEKEFIEKVKNELNKIPNGEGREEYINKNKSHLLNALQNLYEITENSPHKNDAKELYTKIRGLLPTYSYNPAFVGVPYAEGNDPKTYFQQASEFLPKEVQDSLKSKDFILSDDRIEFDKVTNSQIISNLLNDEKHEPVGISIRFERKSDTNQDDKAPKYFYKLFKLEVKDGNLTYTLVENNKAIKEKNFFNNLDVYVPNFEYKIRDTWDTSSQIFSDNNLNEIVLSRMKLNTDILKGVDLDKIEILEDNEYRDITSKLITHAKEEADKIFTANADFEKKAIDGTYSNIVFKEHRIEKLMGDFETLEFDGKGGFKIVSHPRLLKIVTKGFTEREAFRLQTTGNVSEKIGNIDPLNYYWLIRTGEDNFTTEEINLRSSEYTETINGVTYARLKEFIDANFSLDMSYLKDTGISTFDSSGNKLKFTNIKVSELKKYIENMQEGDARETLKKKIDTVYNSFIDNILLQNRTRDLINANKEIAQANSNLAEGEEKQTVPQVTPKALGIKFTVKASANDAVIHNGEFVRNFVPLSGVNLDNIKIANNDGKTYAVFAVKLRVSTGQTSSTKLHYIFYNNKDDNYIYPVDQVPQKFTFLFNKIQKAKENYVSTPFDNPRLIVMDKNGYAETILRNIELPTTHNISSQFVKSIAEVNNYTNSLIYFLIKIHNKGLLISETHKDLISKLENFKGIILQQEGTETRLTFAPVISGKTEEIRSKNKEIANNQIKTLKILLSEYVTDEQEKKAIFNIIRDYSRLEENSFDNYLFDVLNFSDNIREHLQSKIVNLPSNSLKIETSIDGAKSQHYIPVTLAPKSNNNTSITLSGFSKPDETTSELNTVAFSIPLDYVEDIFIKDIATKEQIENRKKVLKDAFIKGWVDYVIYNYNLMDIDTMSPSDERFGDRSIGSNNKSLYDYLSSLLKQDIFGKYYLKNDESTRKEIEKFYIKNSAFFLDNLVNTALISTFENVTKNDFTTGAFINKLKTSLNVEKPLNKVLKYERTVTPATETTSNIPVKKTPNTNKAQPRRSVQIKKELKFQDEVEFKDDYEWSVSDKNITRILNRISPFIKVSQVESIEDARDLINRVKDSATPIGRALGDVIEVTNRSMGLLYHEAFHVVFNQLFTKQEQFNLLSEIEQRLEYTDADIYKIANKREITDFEEAKNIFLEEKLADAFADYRLEKDKYEKGIPNTFLGKLEKLGNWITDFFNKLLSWAGLSKIDKLKQEFNKIDNGYYAKRKPSESKAVRYAYNYKNLKVFRNFEVFNQDTDKNETITQKVSLESVPYNEASRYLQFHIYHNNFDLTNNKTKNLELIVDDLLKNFKVVKQDKNGYSYIKDLVDIYGEDKKAVTIDGVETLTSRTLSKVIEDHFYPAIKEMFNVLERVQEESTEYESIPESTIPLSPELENSTETPFENTEEGEGETQEDPIEDIEGIDINATQQDDTNGATRGVGESALGIDQSKIGKDLVVFLGLIYTYSTNEDGTIDYNYLDVQKFIKKLQKLFSMVPVDRTRLFSSFYEHLKNLSKFDPELLIFKEHLEDTFGLNSDNNAIDYSLLNKLVNALCLNNIFYSQGFVVKKKYGEGEKGQDKTFGEIAMTDAFLNTNRKEIESLIHKRNNTMITANVVFTKEKGKENSESYFFYREGETYYKIPTTLAYFKSFYEIEDGNFPENILDLVRNSGNGYTREQLNHNYDVLDNNKIGDILRPALLENNTKKGTAEEELLKELVQVCTISYFYSLKGINVHMPFAYAALNSFLLKDIITATADSEKVVKEAIIRKEKKKEEGEEAKPKRTYKKKVSYIIKKFDDSDLDTPLCYYAVRFGTYIRGHVIKDNNNNNRYALAKSNILDALNVPKERSLLPTFRVTVALGHTHHRSQNYTDLPEAQKYQFQIGQFKRKAVNSEGTCFLNLGQLADNPTSMFVSTERKDYAPKGIILNGGYLDTTKMDLFFGDFFGMYTDRIGDIIKNYETIRDKMDTSITYNTGQKNEKNEDIFKTEKLLSEEGKQELLKGYDTLLVDDENFIPIVSQEGKTFYKVKIKGKGFNIFYNHFLTVEVNKTEDEFKEEETERTKDVKIEDYVKGINDFDNENSQNDLQLKINQLRGLANTFVINNAYLKYQVKQLLEEEISYIQKVLRDDILKNEGSERNKTKADYDSPAYKAFLADFVMNNITGVDRLYKEVLGSKYNESFKNSTTDLTRRLQAIAAFGESTRAFLKEQIEDVNQYVVEGNGKHYIITEQQYQDTLNPDGSKKEEFKDFNFSPVTVSDGEAMNTFLHKYFLIMDKFRHYPLSLAYYSYLMSKGTVIQNFNEEGSSFYERILNFSQEEEDKYYEELNKIKDEKLTTPQKEKEKLEAGLEKENTILDAKNKALLLFKTDNDKFTQENPGVNQSSLIHDINATEHNISVFEKKLYDVNKVISKIENAPTDSSLNDSPHGKYLTQQAYLKKVTDDAKKNQYMNGISKTVSRGFDETGHTHYDKQASVTLERDLYMKILPGMEDEFAKIFFERVDGKNMGIIPLMNKIQDDFLLKALASPERAVEIQKDIDANLKLIQDLYKKLYNGYFQEDGTYANIIEPLFGQEKTFELMKHAETEGIDMSVYGSGAKGTQIKTPIKFQDGFKVNQTEMNNQKNKILDPTQPQKILLMDINDTTFTAFDGQEYIVANLVDKYIQSIKGIVDYTSTAFTSLLFEDGNPKGNLNIDMLSELFKEFVSTTRNSNYKTAFYEIKKDSFGKAEFLVSPDLAPVANVFFQTLKKIYNTPANIKVNGEAYQAVSSHFYNARLNKDGKVVSIHSNEECVSAGPLQVFLETFNHHTGKFEKTEKSLIEIETTGININVRDVHECVVAATEPWQREYLHDVKQGMSREELDKKYDSSLFYMLSTRIPAENKRSMAILKIIDFISPQSGSIIIQAASAQAQSGGDYDGDKYFAKRFNAIKIGNHWSKVSQDVFNRTELAEFNRQEAIKYLTKDSVFKNIFQEHRSELDYHNYFEQYLKAMEKHKSRAELDNIYLDSALGLASNYYLIKSGLQRENTDASLKLFKKVTKNELIAASEIKRGKMLGFPSSNVKNEREVNKNAKSIERAAFSNMLSVVLNDVGASISARHTLGGKFAFDQVITIKNEKVKGYIKESDEKFCALKNEHMKFLGLKGTEKYVAEEVDLMSKRLAILISVSIDAFKNDFTYGINLTDYTLDVLLSGTMLNIPRNILLGITTHPLVRELTRGENASDDIKEYRTRLLDYIKKSKDDTILAGKEGKKRIKHPEMIIEDLFMYGKGTYSLDIEKKDVRTALAEYRILKLMNDLSDFNNNALFLSSLSSINKGDMEVSSMYNLLNVLDSNVTSTSTSKKEISRINRKYLKGLITEEQQKEELKIVRQNHKNNIKSESTKKSENLKLSEHYGIDLSQISFPRQEGNINYEDLRNFKLFSAYTDSIKMFLGLVRESSLVSKEAINLFNTLHLTRFDINTPNIASVVRDAVNVRNYTNLTKVSAFIEHFTKSSEGKFVYFKEIESEEDKVNKANTIEDFYPNPPFNEANIPVVLELMVNYLKNKFPNNTFVEKLSVWGGSVVFLNYSGSNDLNKESIKNDLEVLIDPGNGIMNQPITDKLGNKLNMSVRQLVEGILKREMYTSGVRWSNKSVVPFIPADFYKDLTEKTRKWNELIKSPKASIGTISLTDMITRLNLSLQNNVQESVLSLLKIKKDTSKELTGLSFLKEANEDEEASGTIVDTFYTDTDASYLLHKGVKYKVFKIDEDRNIAVALIGWKEKYDRQNVSDYERDKIDIYKKPKTLQTVEDLDREAEEEEDNHDKGLNEILSNSLGRLSEQDRENKRVEIIKHNLLSRFNKEEALTEHLKTNNTRIILTPNSVIEISLYDPKVGSFIDRSTNYYGLGINSFSTFGDVVQVITPEDFRKSAGTEDRLSDVILNNIEGLEDKALRIKISRKTYTQDTKMIYYEKGELKQVPIETGFITNEEGTPEKMITGLFSTYLFRHDLEFQDDIDKFNHVIERLPDNQKKEVSEVLINLFSNKYGKEVIRKLNEEVAKVEEDKLKEKNQSLVVNQNTEENNNNSLSNTENKIPAKVINQTSPC